MQRLSEKNPRKTSFQKSPDSNDAYPVLGILIYLSISFLAFSASKRHRSQSSLSPSSAVRLARSSASSISKRSHLCLPRILSLLPHKDLRLRLSHPCSDPIRPRNWADVPAELPHHLAQVSAQQPRPSPGESSPTPPIVRWTAPSIYASCLIAGRHPNPRFRSRRESHHADSCYYVARPMA